MPAEINSDMKSLENVFTDNHKTFHIPDFQRDFVWTGDDAEQLMDDIMEDSDNLSVDSTELQGYLLGNIVLIDKNDKYLVVDGQQRITTLTLLYKVIHDRVIQIVEESAGDRENP